MRHLPLSIHGPGLRRRSALITVARFGSVNRTDSHATLDPLERDHARSRPRYVYVVGSRIEGEQATGLARPIVFEK